MGLIALDCKKCGANLQVDEESSTYTCKYCQTVHERDYSNGATPTPQSLVVMAERSLSRGEYGKAMQFVEQGLAIDPHHTELLALEDVTREKLESLTINQDIQLAEELEQIDIESEAEQNCLQAEFILNELQANLKVYGSNSSFKTPSPADVDLALQYINRSLELCPNDTKYLNLKALLLGEGLNNKDAAIALLEKALKNNPNDITLKNNLEQFKSSGCFIATAAFGSPMAIEVDVLRVWRDKSLLRSPWGKKFVAVYYVISPPIAKFIATRSMHRRVTRWLLRPLVRVVVRKYSK